MNEFENSIVTFKTLQEFINSKDINDTFKGAKNASKDCFLTLTFRTELNELSFKNVKYKKFATFVYCSSNFIFN